MDLYFDEGAFRRSSPPLISFEATAASAKNRAHKEEQ